MRAPPASHPHAEDPLPLLHSTGLPARWRSALPRGGGRPWGARAPFFGGGECLSQRLGLRRAPSGRTPAASVPPSPVSASLYRASTRALTLLYLLPFRVSSAVALHPLLPPPPRATGHQPRACAAHPTQSLVAVARGASVMELDAATGARLGCAPMQAPCVRLAYAPRQGACVQARQCVCVLRSQFAI